MNVLWESKILGNESVKEMIRTQENVCGVVSCLWMVEGIY